MATFKKGILGGFNGKVGPVVGSTYRGLDVLRSVPKKSNKPPTTNQEIQRMKFGLTIRFLSPLKSLINRAFGSPEGAKSRFNLCTSYHSVYALTGSYPNLAIDPTKAVFTKGELGGADATVTSVNPLELTFAWADNSGVGLNLASDLPVLVVYNPAKEAHAFQISNDPRVSQAAILTVPAEFAGDTVHCWIAFLSANGRAASTSIYLGTVVVS